MSSRLHIHKINRAWKHLQNLDVKVRDWFNADYHRYWIEPDPNCPNYLLLKATSQHIPIDPFSLLIGEIVQNLRMGLDHLAFELASEFTNPLPEEFASNSEFPIFGDEDRKGNKGVGPKLFSDAKRKIQGMDPKAQAIIEGLQPYKRGQYFAKHPLWLLQGLSIIDKHRLLHIAATFSGGMACDPAKIINARIDYGRIEVTGGIVKSDTVIARFPFTVIDPASEVSVDVRPTFDVAFTDGIRMGEPVVRILRELHTHIVEKVLPPLWPFIPCLHGPELLR